MLTAVVLSSMENQKGRVYLLLKLPCIFFIPDSNSTVSLIRGRMSVWQMIKYSRPLCAQHPPGPMNHPCVTRGTRELAGTQIRPRPGLGVVAFVSKPAVSQDPADHGAFTCQLVRRRNSHLFTVPDNHESDKGLVPRISGLSKG